MGRQSYLVRVLIIGFIIKGVVTQGSEKKEPTIEVKQIDRNVILTCEGLTNDIVWRKNGEDQGKQEKSLNLGTDMNDPRGVYSCDQANKSRLHVYFRTCQNCIELNASTISGIVVADVIATIFLAIAVYCITGQDRGRLSQVSDRQNLIANEQLYQPLGERDSEPYSRLGVARTRK